MSSHAKAAAASIWRPAPCRVRAHLLLWLFGFVVCAPNLHHFVEAAKMVAGFFSLSRFVSCPPRGAASTAQHSTRLHAAHHTGPRSPAMSWLVFARLACMQPHQVGSLRLGRGHRSARGLLRAHSWGVGTPTPLAAQPVDRAPGARAARPPTRDTCHSF